MKTVVTQKPVNTGTMATTIDFGAASTEFPRLFHPGVYAFRLERAIAPKASGISAGGASSSSGSGSRRITAAPLQNEPARDAERGKRSGSR